MVIDGLRRPCVSKAKKGEASSQSLVSQNRGFFFQIPQVCVLVRIK